jgi:mRNA-degrading endonuclease RelE of RelBE toxin-antitoxin system
MKKQFLLFCGSLLVGSSAVASFSDNVLARDVPAGPIWDNNHAKQICPTVCGKSGWKWTGEWRTTVPGKYSICGCGEWKLVKKGAKFKTNLNGTEQAKYDEFQNKVRNQGLHPKEAAAGWDSDYKNLLRNQYQIRLSQDNRVIFLVDRKNTIVRILEVGGHTR